jgi:hypothetical protein
MVYSVDGTWVQIGIASFGDNLCELMKPKGFTRVQSYLSWIASITGVSVATTQRPPTTPFSCQSDGIKSNPYDCNSFYMCSNGTPYLFVSFNNKQTFCDRLANKKRSFYTFRTVLVDWSLILNSSSATIARMSLNAIINVSGNWY